eukprot:COSAG04_NODE_6377_length_1343_cov_1.668810_1_plen_182_part_10
MMAGGKEDPKDGMNFMYAAPPGLKEVQEREEAEKARRQQLDNVGLGAERERFLANVANAPTDGAFAAGKTNDVHVQPFGVDPKDVREAQKANRKLGEGKMAGQDNPFVSHRSTAMDNVKLKDQESGSSGSRPAKSQTSCAVRAACSREMTPFATTQPCSAKNARSAAVSTMLCGVRPLGGSL